MVIGDFSGVIGGICMLLMLIHGVILFRAYKQREIHRELSRLAEALQKSYSSVSKENEVNISIKALKFGLKKGCFNFDKALKAQFRQIVNEYPFEKEVTINLTKTA